MNYIKASYINLGKPLNDKLQVNEIARPEFREGARLRGNLVSLLAQMRIPRTEEQKRELNTNQFVDRAGEVPCNIPFNFERTLS